MDITFRPRLTKGRHLQTVDEYGPFCLVEAIGFNVDGKVHDEHPSIDPVLGALARAVNDRMCKHFDHPIAAAAGLIGSTSDICDPCQARLWALGERVAGTGTDRPDWTGAELVQVHVRMAIAAARAAAHMIEGDDLLRGKVAAALEAAEVVAGDPSFENRKAARVAASRVENHESTAAAPAYWAGQAVAAATRAAVSVDGDGVGTVTPTYYFATRRAVDTMGYAIGAVEGSEGRCMGLARKVLNAFGAEVAAAERGAQAAAEELAAAETAAEDQVDARIAAERAAANAEERAGDDEGDFNATRYEVDESGDAPSVPCGNSASQGEPMLAHGADPVDAQDFDAFAERAAAAKAAQQRRQTAAWLEAPAWALTPVELPTEEHDVIATLDGEPMTVPALAARLAPNVDDEDMNDFDESELGDVADEAIGDLERAETILNAVAAEHRPVAAWTRRRPPGFNTDIEYQTDCCISCRDAEGQPVPAPCRTMIILNSYGEGL